MFVFVLENPATGKDLHVSNACNAREALGMFELMLNMKLQPRGDGQEFRLHTFEVNSGASWRGPGKTFFAC
jgi:hypothetical protein